MYNQAIYEPLYEKYYNYIKSFFSENINIIETEVSCTSKSDLDNLSLSHFQPMYLEKNKLNGLLSPTFPDCIPGWYYKVEFIDSNTLYIIRKKIQGNKQAIKPAGVYEAAFHEMTHALDYYLGKEITKEFDGESMFASQLLYANLHEEDSWIEITKSIQKICNISGTYTDEYYDITREVLPCLQQNFINKGTCLSGSIKNSKILNDVNDVIKKTFSSYMQCIKAKKNFDLNRLFDELLLPIHRQLTQEIGD